MKPAFLFTGAAMGLAMAMVSAEAMPLQTRQRANRRLARGNRIPILGLARKRAARDNKADRAEAAVEQAWLRDQEVMRSRTGANRVRGADREYFVIQRASILGRQ